MGTSIPLVGYVPRDSAASGRVLHTSALWAVTGAWAGQPASLPCSIPSGDGDPVRRLASHPAARGSASEEAEPIRSLDDNHRGPSLSLGGTVLRGSWGFWPPSLSAGLR